jgi:transcriptional regulator with XRE-family HTH domain
MYIICQGEKRLYHYFVGNHVAQLREIFAHNLKEKRRKSGFTQTKLAEMVSVSTHHIAMIEIARNYPTLELTERIAEALGIEIYELFIAPLSPREELERLYDTVARNIDNVVSEAIEKALSGKWKQ